MNLSLCTVIASPSLERPITDWLLEQEIISGFTSLEVHGHGSKPESLSLIEQVEGRKKQIMFQIHMTSDIESVFINNLKQNFNDADIHYWIVPILAAGSLINNS